MSHDAMFCHQQAMKMAARLNSNAEVVSTAESLVAAATVGPEAMVDETLPDSGATVSIASCVVLLGGVLASLAFF